MSLWEEMRLECMAVCEGCRNCGGVDVIFDETEATARHNEDGRTKKENQPKTDIVEH